MTRFSGYVGDHAVNMVDLIPESVGCLLHIFCNGAHARSQLTERIHQVGAGLNDGVHLGLQPFHLLHDFGLGRLGADGKHYQNNRLQENGKRNYPSEYKEYRRSGWHEAPSLRNLH